MGIKLYVGNLSYGVGDGDLEKLFIAYGSVSSAQVIKDRDNGRSKGFGFVEMGTSQEGQAAITALNGKNIDGRPLVVNEARPKEETRGGKGGFGGGGRDRDGGGGRDRGGFGGAGRR
jgi:RNA recognition motif-containing protein